MLRKSTIVLSSYSSLQSFCIPASNSTTSSCLFHQTWAKWKAFTRPQNNTSHAYAMVAGGHNRNKHEALPWPEVIATNTIPTPYQIFNQRKGSPYSKRRFYELVKMYHPDRHGLDELSDGLPYAVKLERYRLVVAANELLSDPIKRAAYDCYGAGWNGQLDAMAREGWGGYTGRSWEGGRGGPFQNATWEDWEKWYNRDEPVKQRPVFFSNGAFVAFVVIFSALGGVIQATRADNVSMALIEQRDALHNQMSKELMRIRRESEAIGDRDVRVTMFLKERDPFGNGGADPMEEGYCKVLPPQDICSSGGIQACSMDAYDTKSKPKD